MPFAWATFLKEPQHGRTFYANFLQSDSAREQPAVLCAAPTEAAASGVTRRPSSATVAHGPELLGLVVATLRKVVGQPVEPDMPLVQAGIDSLGALQSVAASAVKVLRYEDDLQTCKHATNASDCAEPAS